MAAGFGDGSSSFERGEWAGYRERPYRRALL
jgi:hypothetical protein